MLTNWLVSINGDVFRGLSMTYLKIFIKYKLIV